jgi:UDP-glucose 4-epimerase
MRILVTGGAGFIGSHVADRLVSDGHDAVVYDNLATGLREYVPTAAQFVNGDVSQIHELDRAFSGGLDAVFHIAGQVSLIHSYTDPVVDLQTNVQGTLNILTLCVKHRVPRLLYASSMTVYSSNVSLPTPEDSPCEPTSYYGITKYAAERYVHATAERRDLDFPFKITAFRMYNVYGPRQALNNPYQGVLGIFLGNLLRGEPITIFGDGEQSRDFIYIRDIVDAWAGTLKNPASYGKSINLGSGKRRSINCVADAVLSAFDRTRADHPVNYAPGRSGEQRHVEADITLARQLLGWEPRVSFETGLAETLQWSVASMGATAGTK